MQTLRKLTPEIQTSRRAPLASDLELLEGLMNDDARAWRLFNERYSRLIHGCIRRVLGSFRSVTPEDAAEEIYATFALQLLQNDKKKLRSYDPTRSTHLSTWIGLLAIRAAYDYLRSLKREPPRDGLNAAERLVSPTPDPFSASLDRERARALARLIAELSARDREFVELYYGEGLDTPVIAARMGISFKTVYSKKHKIRTRLESLLGESGSAAA